MTLHRFSVITLVILFFTINSIYSQEVIGDTSQPSIQRDNAVNIYPIALVTGNFAGNYEHLFNNRHGLMVQGSFAFGKATGFSAALHYRYHYFSKPQHTGLNSPFWGPFAYYEKSNADVKVKSDDIDTTYNVDVTYMKVGANWGRRWMWGNGFNIGFRIGYGLPLIAEFDWHGETTDLIEQVESITKVVAGIDGEFSIGIAF